MKLSGITFKEESKIDLLELFEKTLDDDGYIVEIDNVNQRVLTPKGEEIHISEWAGVIKGSETFVKSDAFSLMEIAKKIE
ncbi:MAG: hypothetical protein KKC19_03705 [Nanoarchaeota archaeon]|nr:hypothetical protein [Nanoarchaeota archaeon]